MCSYKITEFLFGKYSCILAGQLEGPLQVFQLSSYSLIRNVLPMLEMLGNFSIGISSSAVPHFLILFDIPKSSFLQGTR
jgi:hypothetical protein